MSFPSIRPCSRLQQRRRRDGYSVENIAVHQMLIMRMENVEWLLRPYFLLHQHYRGFHSMEPHATKRTIARTFYHRTHFETTQYQMMHKNTINQRLYQRHSLLLYNSSIQRQTFDGQLLTNLLNLKNVQSFDFYNAAKSNLDQFLRDSRYHNALCINAAFGLFEHIILVNHNRSNTFLHDHVNWIFDARYLNGILYQWNLLILPRDTVNKRTKKKRFVRAKLGSLIPPEDLLQRIDKMRNKFPELCFDSIGFTYLLDASIRLSIQKEAPIIGETLIDKYCHSAQLVVADTHMYVPVFQAWAMSQRKDSELRMSALICKLRKEYKIKPNIVLYNICLRYFAERGQVQMMKELHSTMEEDGITPGMSQLVYGHCTAGNMKEARTVLFEMITNATIDEATDTTSTSSQRKSTETLHTKTMMKPIPTHVTAAVIESAQTILIAYRKLVDARCSVAEKRQHIDDAEKVFDHINANRNLFDNRNFEKLMGSMYYLYANAGLFQKAEALSRRLPLSPNQYSMLITALGRSESPNKASEILVHAIDKRPHTVDNHMLNSVLNVWAKSGRPKAYTESLKVFKKFDTNDTLRRNGIQTNVISFNGLLKCMVNQTKDVEEFGKVVNETIDELGRRNDAGHFNCKPDVITYNLALKCCLKAKDEKTFERVMDHMKNSDTPPNQRTYIAIMMHWSQQRQADAPQRAEEMLYSMKEMAIANAELTPNAFAYSIVMGSWMKSDALDASERMWNIYELMVRDMISIDKATYNMMISTLSRSTKLDMVHRANDLLKDICAHAKLKPDYLHFVDVVNGFVSLGKGRDARSVLENRLTEYINGNVDCKPQSKNFTTVLKSLCAYKGDLQYAHDFLLSIQKRFDNDEIPCGPDVDAYKEVVNAWRLFDLDDSDHRVQELMPYLWQDGIPAVKVEKAN